MDFTKARLYIWLVEEMVLSERFDKNEECRCLCIDHIFKFFDLELDAVENIRKTNNFIKTFRYLKKTGLNIQAYIDKRLLLNPKYLFYLFIPDIHCSKSFFHETIKDGVYFYYTSAKELYGINELWTHCVCEFYHDGERTLFDSYFNQICKEYPYITSLTHEELKNKLVITIKIRR